MVLIVAAAGPTSKGKPPIDAISARLNIAAPGVQTKFYLSHPRYNAVASTARVGRGERAVPIEKLEPGDYTFRVTLSDGQHREVREATVRVVD